MPAAPINGLKMRWRNTKTNVRIEKSAVTFAGGMFLSRTCSITSEINIRWIMTPRSGSWRNQLKKYGSPGYEDAYMFETGPDGMVFLADIFKNQGFFHVVVRVMG